MPAPIGTRLIVSTPHPMATSTAPPATSDAASDGRLLRRPALGVDGGGGDGQRHAGRQPRRPGDVEGLLADLRHAAADQLADLGRVDPGAVHDLLQDRAEEVGGVHGGQAPVAAPDGRAEGFDDDDVLRAQRHGSERNFATCSTPTRVARPRDPADADAPAAVSGLRRATAAVVRFDYGKGAALIGEEEREAVDRVMRSRSLFRYYGPDLQGTVAGFEARRLRRSLGVPLRGGRLERHRRPAVRARRRWRRAWRRGRRPGVHLHRAR